MTAITLTQAGVFNGQIHNAGDTVDVSDGDAAWIVSAGRAVLATSATVTAATIAADTADRQPAAGSIILHIKRPLL